MSLQQRHEKMEAEIEPYQERPGESDCPITCGLDFGIFLELSVLPSPK